ncbi:MAG: alcohol dehydrogenase catalytic domain-containing protein [Planctomycetes bacterium]|nr:alcohol dehydrogenase catalytic domain-containing protein [Planctomycetota bacterium]
MKALVWDGETLRFDNDRARPEVPEGWARLRVRCAGICSTDQQILKGYMDFKGIPGHEFVGEVLEGPDEMIGKRVTCEINFACGTCPACLRDMGRHCPTRTVLGIMGSDGAFAEEVAAPIANLRVVPDSVSDEQAVFTEPLAAAYEILEQVHLEPGQRVVVLGDGKLGQLCAQVMHSAGAQVQLIGKHPCKLEHPASLGIHTTLLEDFDEAPAPLVVEATGSEKGLAMAMRVVSPRGTLVLKSTVAASHELSLAPLVINEVTVVGSRCGRFEPALQALAQGRVSVEAMIHGEFSLEEGVAAFERSREQGVLKVLLRPS